MFAVFALCERKNRKQMIVKYHAAAGRNQLQRGRPRKSCY
jgi:hypothetical protein